MNGPTGVGIVGATLWVANNTGKNLQAWTVSGSMVATLNSYGTTLFGYTGPLGTGPDSSVYVGDTTNDQIVEFTPTGAYVTVFGNAELGADYPGGVAVGSGDAYLADAAGKIFHYSISGSGNSKSFTYQAVFGNSGAGTLGGVVEGICLDVAGNLYVSDFLNNRLVKFGPGGNYLSAVTLLSSGTPAGVAVDPAGYIYVTDNTNLEVQQFNPSGGPVTQWGSSYMVNPAGLALDSSGSLYVADHGANQVYVYKKN